MNDAQPENNEMPPCQVCGEPVDWGIQDVSGVCWHPECFRPAEDVRGILG